MKKTFGTHRGVDLPIFRDTAKDYANLEFLRDSMGRWTHVEVQKGWYQDREGNLYRYDGVVWDEVPSVRIEDLEYLG